MASKPPPAEWTQARQWLISSGVIPVVHPVTKPSVDLVDFARSLRDGVFLCSLLLKMKPGCIENFNPRPILQHTFIKNILSFLAACKTHFHINEDKLFEDSDLYEVTNFGKVVQLLSVLSQTQEAIDKGWQPFPPTEVHHDYYHDLDELMAAEDDNEEPQSNGSGVQEESIYANLEQLAFQRNSEVMVYDDPPVSEDPYGDSSIYEAIVHLRKNTIKPSPVDLSEKRKYILQELYETERNYVDVLDLIGQHFYNAMKVFISTEDVKLLFSIPQVLLECHRQLLAGFKLSYEKGRSTELSTYFFKEREELLRYGEYAAILPKATERAKYLLTTRDCGRAMQICQETSHQKFSLSELLSVPVQRILKYPLLVTELMRCAKKEGAVSEVDNLNELHSYLEDISKYINETKRDFEAVKIIEEIEQCLIEYKGPPLLECGRYRFDGELRIKSYDEKGDLKKRWAFLFDKVLIICKRGNIIRTLGEVKYTVKWVLNVDGLFLSSDSQRLTTIKRVVPPFKLCAIEYGSKNHTEFSMNGKSLEHKQNWMESFKLALTICHPEGSKSGGHNFDLVTTEGAAKCSSCNKLLWGMYHQGYRCKDCGSHSHSDCILSQKECVKVSPLRKVTSVPMTVSPSPGMRSRLHSTPSQPNPRAASTSQLTVNGAIDNARKGVIYIAKMKYEGNPLRRGQYLTFEKDEQLEILDQSDPEWWEAISLTTGNKGKVPCAYLKPRSGYERVNKTFITPSVPPVNLQSSLTNLPSTSALLRRGSETLADHPWYVGCLSRIEAENMLKDLQDGVFLIRESDQRRGEYAIGLRWKQHPKHIKVTYNPANHRFFVSDAKDFGSVPELVQYYQEHSLGFSFPGVDTTLRCPYWDVRRSSQPPVPAQRSNHPPPIPEGRPVLPSSSPAPVYCEALYSFTAEYNDELSLQKHCRIRLVSKETSRPQWWLGEFRGNTGLFPSNYVKELPSGH